MKNFLLLTLILGWFAAGCGWERAAAPQPQESSWGLARYHQTTDGQGFLDLTVRSNGELTLTDGRGNAQSGGLLAGEKLETLARLIDALPPQSYAPSAPCAPDGYFVSVTRGGEVRTFASGACDADPPAALADLAALFSDLASQVGERRVQAVGFRVLARGTLGGVHIAQREIVHDRDALLSLVREIQCDAPVAIPRVDFGREMVIGEFLGDCPGNGYSVDVEGTEMTESGWLRVRFRQGVPSGDCVAGVGLTQPYVLVAVQGQGGDVLFETETVAQTCPNPVQADDTAAGR